MSGPASTPQRLVDTVALAALCQSSYEDEVFSLVPITVTRCCFEEIKRGANDADHHSYQSGCQTVLEKIRDRGDNLELFSTGLECKNRHGYLKENIGEKSIAKALEDNSHFSAVVSFDDDVIDDGGGISEEMKRMFRQEIPDFVVAPANEPLYKLYRSEKLTKAQFVEGTRKMIRQMNWDESENVDLFWETYDETFDR